MNPTSRFHASLIALTLALSGCSAVTALAPAAGDAGFDALASAPGARTVKTEIGTISLGLLPETGAKGKRKAKSESMPTFESEVGLPGFSVMSQALPKQVDLRDYFSPVRNQGSLGSCSAFAATALMEAMANIKGAKAAGKKVKHLSPLFFYYAERQMMQDDGLIPKATKKDTGAFMFVAADTAEEIGAVPETMVPYRTGKAALAYDASEKEYAAAKEFKSERATRIKTLHGMKQALAQKKPFIFPILIYQSFATEEVAKTGVMPLPKSNEEIMGGHAVVAVGYDDAKQAFIVRNSWGTEWGDKGHFYMPYDYFKSAYVGQFNYGECWTLD